MRSNLISDCVISILGVYRACLGKALSREILVGIALSRGWTIGSPEVFSDVNYSVLMDMVTAMSRISRVSSYLSEKTLTR